MAVPGVQFAVGGKRMKVPIQTFLCPRFYCFMSGTKKTYPVLWPYPHVRYVHAIRFVLSGTALGPFRYECSVLCYQEHRTCCSYSMRQFLDANLKDKGRPVRSQ